MGKMSDRATPSYEFQALCLTKIIRTHQTAPGRIYSLGDGPHGDASKPHPSLRRVNLQLGREKPDPQHPYESCKGLQSSGEKTPYESRARDSFCMLSASADSTLLNKETRFNLS